MPEDEKNNTVNKGSGSNTNNVVNTAAVPGNASMMSISSSDRSNVEEKKTDNDGDIGGVGKAQSDSSKAAGGGALDVKKPLDGGASSSIIGEKDKGMPPSSNGGGAGTELSVSGNNQDNKANITSPPQINTVAQSQKSTPGGQEDKGGAAKKEKSQDEIIGMDVDKNSGGNTDNPGGRKRSAGEAAAAAISSSKGGNGNTANKNPPSNEPPTKVARYQVEGKTTSTSEKKVDVGTVNGETQQSQSQGTTSTVNTSQSSEGDGSVASTAAAASTTSTDDVQMQPPSDVDDDYEVPECDVVFKAMVKLDKIPASKPLPPLTPRELSQLELSLQIGEKFSNYTDYTTWREDWNGNLQLIDKDLIMNRDQLAKNPDGKRITIQFCDYVAKHARHADDFGGIKYLFSFIYNMTDTPSMAKRILAYYLQCPATSVAERLSLVLEATRRISYDPSVLSQDGWTTVKSDVPDGYSGGSHLIGRRVIWHSYEAIVIAFVRDEDIGDLWKCMWVEDHDTFDLEADELQEGMKKWERRASKRKVPLEKASSKPSRTSSSARFEESRKFTVEGVEEGIILAKSYKAKGGRPWPARIMHVTEVKELGVTVTSRRSSSKSEIHVVFLAPYWNGTKNGTNGSEAQRAKSQFSTGPLFELETMDVSSETIMKYPYNTETELSIDNIRNEFSFLGLPKAAFSRFLDAHRIAMALKSYANQENKKSVRADAVHADTFSSLTDTHPLSIKTFFFPDAMLNLPFGYILSKYPDPTETRSKMILNDDTSELKEPVMQLHTMLQSITPPNCWGENEHAVGNNALRTPKKDKSFFPQDSYGLTPTISPSLNLSARAQNASTKELWKIGNFASDYFLRHIEKVENGISPLSVIQSSLSDLVKSLNQMVVAAEQASFANLDSRQKNLSSFIIQLLAAKGHGEEFIFAASLPQDYNRQNLILEWRKACERIFRRAVVRMGHMETGNGVTVVITDSRCNEHITSNGSFERAVRLPAAIRGAKLAGAGSRPNLRLITKVEDSYMTTVEDRILPMAHKSSYLKRIKTKVSNIPQDAKGVPLTDDSDGEGGEDTTGSRGSFTAAVTGVAAALKGVDMIIGGKCLNAFCAVRPPGHHAGRELKPMNAISNGFCLLNAAACAALYAATPRSQGGLGLKRVCVIDIDLHHGNGTQDILCSTHDPRFFYVSTHAGGPHINGYEDDNSDDGLRRNLNMNKNEGIYPGRCGDTSPHPGVLNVPLGKKVTPSSLGTALVTQVTPAVERFDPELIIISAGFDAHINDPLGMGGLSSDDFGTVTKVICQMAMKSCSGRVLSILEGGYGVPCCRPLARDLFLPDKNNGNTASSMKLLDLGKDLPDNMEDNVDFLLAKKLDRCHQEGFLECVKEHVRNLSNHADCDSSSRKSSSKAT